MAHQNASLSTEERFWMKVARGGPDDCWLWSATVDRKRTSGYGRFGFRRALVLAHRMSWILERGPIPDGKQVLHSCDVRYPPGDITYRRCVNPAHLWLGTHQENIRDAVTKKRTAQGDRHRSVRRPDLTVRGEAWRARFLASMRRGERHPSAKLKPVDVRAIRVALADGESCYSIGKRYGVCDASIRKILQGKSWAHVA